MVIHGYRVESSCGGVGVAVKPESGDETTAPVAVVVRCGVVRIMRKRGEVGRVRDLACRAGCERHLDELVAGDDAMFSRRQAAQRSMG